MTVWDNVAFGPRSQRLGKAEVARRVDELLEVVRLTEFVKRARPALGRPAAAGGARPRLVNYPSASCSTSRSAALDLKLREVMQFELKRIQREVGITFVYVTHDQEEALTMSDRIAVMDAGRVQQIGTPVEIYERPANVFVAGFIGQANLWSCRVTGARRATSSSRRWARRCLGPWDTHIEAGRDAAVMVRPERVHVAVERPGATDAVNAVEATVADLTSKGRWFCLALAAPDGSPIVAQVGHEVELPLLRPGDGVGELAGVGIPRAARRRHPHHRRPRRDVR